MLLDTSQISKTKYYYGTLHTHEWLVHMSRPNYCNFLLPSLCYLWLKLYQCTLPCSFSVVLPKYIYYTE